MKALLILAHGSRKQQSNEEVKRLADSYSDKFKGSFDSVYAGFMELAEPDIHQTVKSAIEGGAKELIILPYFLAAGAHVVEDIPQLIDDSLQQFPAIKYQILPHIGGAEGMIDLIHTLCSEAQ